MAMVVIVLVITRRFGRLRMGRLLGFACFFVDIPRT
jgi:hypothetical protein